jgi:hypothetical protein
VLVENTTSRLVLVEKHHVSLRPPAALPSWSGFNQHKSSFPFFVCRFSFVIYQSPRKAITKVITNEPEKLKNAAPLLPGQAARHTPACAV